MMTGDRLQLGHDPTRHAAYVGSWIQALRDDPREIYRASQDAQVMSDYVLGRVRETVTERDSEFAAGHERLQKKPFRPPVRQPKHQRLFRREIAGPSR